MSLFKLTIFVHRYYILIKIYAIVINWVIVIIFVSTNMWKLCITFSFPYIGFKPFFHHQQLQKRLIKTPIFFIFQIQIKFLGFIHLHNLCAFCNPQLNFFANVKYFLYRLFTPFSIRKYITRHSQYTCRLYHLYHFCGFILII